MFCTFCVSTQKNHETGVVCGGSLHDLQTGMESEVFVCKKCSQLFHKECMPAEFGDKKMCPGCSSFETEATPCSRHTFHYHESKASFKCLLLAFLLAVFIPSGDTNRKREAFEKEVVVWSKHMTDAWRSWRNTLNQKYKNVAADSEWATYQSGPSANDSWKVSDLLRGLVHALGRGR